jgi:hypothetical protein
MAERDVHVHQAPSDGSGGAGWVVAVVAIVLLVLVIWFLFGRGGVQEQQPTIEIPEQIDVDINAPQATPPQ